MTQLGRPQRVVESVDERVALRARHGRKSADLVIDARFPQGRDHLWAAIRQLRCFTKLELEAATRMPMTTLQTYLRGLTLAGYLEHNAPAPRQPATWRLVRDVGVDAPRVTSSGKPVTQGLGRERLWQSMRILKDFSIDELISAASTAEVSVARASGLSYVKALTQAGYLRGSSHPTATGRVSRYRLVPALNTGPRPPMIQCGHQLFDPNLGRVMWPRETP